MSKEREKLAGEQAGGDGASSAVPAPRYTVRPVVKPLASAAEPARSTHTPRAENEDDDGYDPYSDVHDGTAGPLHFERDPWH